jgi:HNH endonuclease
VLTSIRWDVIISWVLRFRPAEEATWVTFKEIDMSENEVKGNVRRRDRFQCQNCGQKGQQYAHIVPESDGGEYVLGNLLFLCYDCHNYWQEPARATPQIKANLIELSQKLRDKKKTDDILSSVFSWSAGEKLAVVFGGGIRLVDQERILERKDDSARPYLTLRVDDFKRLRINAYFDDAEGRDFMHITDNHLKVHAAAAWDIVFARRKIRFEHSDRKMKLEIHQSENLDLHIVGNLYQNGGYYEIDDDRILDVKNGIELRGNQKTGHGRGLLLSPDTIAF